jgi:hypothetical protein
VQRRRQPAGTLRTSTHSLLCRLNLCHAVMEEIYTVSSALCYGLRMRFTRAVA